MRRSEPLGVRAHVVQVDGGVRRADLLGRVRPRPCQQRDGVAGVSGWA
jgi:hypothetical protein